MDCSAGIPAGTTSVFGFDGRVATAAFVGCASPPTEEKFAGNRAGNAHNLGSGSGGHKAKCLAAFSGRGAAQGGMGGALYLVADADGDAGTGPAGGAGFKTALSWVTRA